MPLTNFPGSLDVYVNPASGDLLSSVVVPHWIQHSQLNDAVTAIQTKIGIDGSSVTSSFDYLLKNTASVNPGHKHTFGAFADVTLVSPASGEVLFYTGSYWTNSALSTTYVSEGTNQYFTSARVRASSLTGLSISPSSTISSTDTVLGAFGKLQAQLNTIGVTAGVPSTRTLQFLGTTNQISVDQTVYDLSANRAWTFSLPQNIHTGATPTFKKLTLQTAASGGDGSYIVLDHGDNASPIYIRAGFSGYYQDTLRIEDDYGSQFQINSVSGGSRQIRIGGEVNTDPAITVLSTSKNINLYGNTFFHETAYHDNNKGLAWADSGSTNRSLFVLDNANNTYVGPIATGWGATTYLQAGTGITLNVNGSSGSFTTAGAITSTGIASYVGLSNYITSGDSVIVSQSVASGSSLFRATAAAGQYRGLQLLSSSLRWWVASDNVSESGSNVGGDFFIARYDDTGGYLGLPFVIKRSTGAVTIENLTGTGTRLTLASSSGVLSTLALGTSSQYLRGDNSYQTLNQAAVAGLTTSSSPTFTGLTLSATLNTSAGYTQSGSSVNTFTGETIFNASPIIGNDVALRWYDSIGTTRRVILVSAANTVYLGPADGSWGANTLISAGTSLSMRVNGAVSFATALSIDTDTSITLASLAGTGTRLVTATSAGLLSSTSTSTFESAITAGTTSQYWRGDKSWQTLNQAAVAGLTTSDSPTFSSLSLNGKLSLLGGSTWTTNGWAEQARLLNGGAIRFGGFSDGVTSNFGIGNSGGTLYLWSTFADTSATYSANYWLSVTPTLVQFVRAAEFTSTFLLSGYSGTGNRLAVLDSSGYVGRSSLDPALLLTTTSGLQDPGANGVVVRTAAGTTTARTLTGTSNQVTVTNGSGVSGNPTFSLPQDIATTSNVNFGTVTTSSYVAANSVTAYAGITNYVSSGTSTISSQSVAGGQALFVADTATSQYTGFQTKTAGVLHWFFGQDNSSQSGSNTGGDFFMARYSDAGSYLGLAFSISRANNDTSWFGNFGINIAPSVPLHIQDSGTDKGILLRAADGGNSLRIGFSGTDKPYLDSTAGQDMNFMISGSGKFTISSSLVSTNQAFTASGLITGSAGANITGQTYSTTGFLVNNYQSYKSKNAAGTAVDLFYLDNSDNYIFSASSGTYYEWLINGSTKLRLNSTGLNVAGSGNATAAFQVGKGLNLASLSVDPSSTTNLFVSTYNYYSDAYQNLFLDQARLTIRPSGTGTTTGQYIYTSTGFGIGGDANYKFDIVGPGSNVDAMQIQKGSGEGGLRFSYANANHISYIRTYEDGTNSYMNFGVATGTSTNTSVLKLFGDRTGHFYGGLTVDGALYANSNHCQFYDFTASSKDYCADFTKIIRTAGMTSSLGLTVTGLSSFTYGGSSNTALSISGELHATLSAGSQATGVLHFSTTGGEEDKVIGDAKTIHLADVSTTAATTTGQFLRWNQSTTKWEPYKPTCTLTLMSYDQMLTTGDYSGRIPVPEIANGSASYTIKKIRWYRDASSSGNTFQLKKNGSTSCLTTAISSSTSTSGSSTTFSTSSVSSGDTLHINFSATDAASFWMIQVDLELA